MSATTADCSTSLDPFAGLSEPSSRTLEFPGPRVARRTSEMMAGGFLEALDLKSTAHVDTTPRDQSSSEASVALLASASVGQILSRDVAVDLILMVPGRLHSRVVDRRAVLGASARGAMPHPGLRPRPGAPTPRGSNAITGLRLGSALLFGQPLWASARKRQCLPSLARQKITAIRASTSLGDLT